MPSFSAQAAAGKTTSASCAVSVKKMSCTTRKSSASSAWRTCPALGSDSSGFSPMMYMALISPAAAASIISTTVRPGLADREFDPQAWRKASAAWGSSTRR